MAMMKRIWESLFDMTEDYKALDNAIQSLEEAKDYLFNNGYVSYANEIAYMQTEILIEKEIVIKNFIDNLQVVAHGKEILLMYGYPVRTSKQTLNKMIEEDGLEIEIASGNIFFQ